MEVHVMDGIEITPELEDAIADALGGKAGVASRIEKGFSGGRPLKPQGRQQAIQPLNLARQKPQRPTGQLRPVSLPTQPVVTAVAPIPNPSALVQPALTASQALQQAVQQVQAEQGIQSREEAAEALVEETVGVPPSQWADMTPEQQAAMMNMAVKVKLPNANVAVPGPVPAALQTKVAGVPVWAWGLGGATLATLLMVLLRGRGK